MNLSPQDQQALARSLQAALEGTADADQLARLKPYLSYPGGHLNLPAVVPLPPDLFVWVEGRAAEEGTTPYDYLRELIINSRDARLKRRPGPPKGRPLKVRQGGDWTPLFLRAEMQKLGISEARLAEAMGVSNSAVHKWATVAIPDRRQAQLTEVLRGFEQP